VKKVLLAAAALGMLTSPALAVDHTINPANWRACAVGPLSDIGGEADWAAVPDWTRDPAISRWFYNEPRLLANHGLCKSSTESSSACPVGT
jgi:hypothetical protein